MSIIIEGDPVAVVVSLLAIGISLACIVRDSLRP